MSDKPVVKKVADAEPRASIDRIKRSEKHRAFVQPHDAETSRSTDCRARYLCTFRDLRSNNAGVISAVVGEPRFYALKPGDDLVKCQLCFKEPELEVCTSADLVSTSHAIYLSFSGDLAM